MSKLNFVTLLSLSTLAFLISRPASSDGIYAVVTPNGYAAMRCEIRPAQEPPVVEKDLMRFKVTVNGGAAPYHWRLPLYTTSNGLNKIKVARVGKVRPSHFGNFYIDVNLADLDKAAVGKEIAFHIESQDHKDATCSMPAAPIQTLVRATLPALQMNSSLTY